MTDAIQTDREALRASLALIYGARVSPKIVTDHLLSKGDPFRVDRDDQLFGSELHLGERELGVADEIIEQCAAIDVQALTIVDEAYPAFLRIIPGPPPILFARGDLLLLKSLPGVAIVGSRSATPHGAEIARRIASYLASKGWVIISGLAIGIDAAAHRGALDAKGKTIAVLAHGLVKASPAQNRGLADEILKTGGLWISEHAPNVTAKKNFFVERNRIQAGLAAGSIIVEGHVESGSMTQAQYCLGQRRKLFAVVPPAGNHTLNLISDGPKMLVTEHGAIPIESLNDYERLLTTLTSSRSLLLEGWNRVSRDS